MAYTPTTWADGDIITAEKMNKLENAVADSGSTGGVMFIHTITYNKTTEYWATDKTKDEVIEFILNNNMVYIDFESIGNTNIPNWEFFIPLTHINTIDNTIVFSTYIEGDNVKAILNDDGLIITSKGSVVAPEPQE